MIYFDSIWYFGISINLDYHNSNIHCPAIIKTSKLIDEFDWFKMIDCINFPRESAANGDLPSYTVDVLAAPFQLKYYFTDDTIVYGLSFRRDSNFNVVPIGGSDWLRGYFFLFAIPIKNSDMSIPMNCC